MAELQHGILEDICAEIGYTATCALVDWFGGRSLFIPERERDSHDIARVIGLKAMRRLCLAFGSQTVSLPLDHMRELTRRDKLIAALLATGHGTRDVARIAILTERQVQNIRRRLEEDGMLPLILRDVENDRGPREPE